MENQFECIKIKDGLYLGTLGIAQDYQFLCANRFLYMINCSAQIPNYFDSHGIKYLKFKLIKQKSHKLWDQNLKKLRKLQKFIQQAQDQSLCCLIYSASGNNRSLVMLVAFMMSKYRWNLSKTLEYIRSKQVFIGLSEHYITQLQQLEIILNNQQDKPKLSSSWRSQYINIEDQIISKTYLNSQQIVIEDQAKKLKKQKRVTWGDKIQKQKKKQTKHKSINNNQQLKKLKNTHVFNQQHDKQQIYNTLSSKTLKQQSSQSPLKKIQNIKKCKKNIKNTSLSKIENIGFKLQDNQNKKQRMSVEDRNTNIINEKDLLNLIKKNLKIKKQQKNQIEYNQDKQNAKDKIYKLTINNFISPSINIVNTLPQKNTQKNNKSTKLIKKQQKINRTISQKQHNKKVNQSIKSQTNKSQARIADVSPHLKQKKIEKNSSIQYKKCN